MHVVSVCLLSPVFWRDLSSRTYSKKNALGLSIGCQPDAPWMNVRTAGIGLTSDAQLTNASCIKSLRGNDEHNKLNDQARNFKTDRPLGLEKQWS